MVFTEQIPLSATPAVSAEGRLMCRATCILHLRTSYVHPLLCSKNVASGYVYSMTIYNENLIFFKITDEKTASVLTEIYRLLYF